MQDFSKSKYSEDDVRREILKIKTALNIRHMPSRTEMLMVTGNTKLINVVMKTGGFRFWAEKMGLDIKGSATEMGYRFEEEAKARLQRLGHEAELTPVKFPYDILVDGVTKIDVKAGNKYISTDSSWYTFNLEAKYPKADFLIVYCIDKGDIKHTYIIPAHIMLGKSQLSMGENTMYKQYEDRWDLISRHTEAMKACIDMSVTA